MLFTHAPARARVAALAALAFACLSFLGGSTAAARSTDPEVARAYEIAKQHWGVAPCGDRVAFSWVQREPDLNGEAFWAAFDAHDPSTFHDCRIELNSAAPFDWPMLCTVVVHEVGHLLGKGHTDDSSDVMHDLYAGPIPVCRPEGGTVEAATVAEPRAVTTAPRPAARKRSRCTRRSARSVRRTTSGRRVVCTPRKKARTRA